MDSPTQYPDINLSLKDLLNKIQTILGDEFVGMYLFGSLALGDFAPDSSDIDILVATKNHLANNVLKTLATMHQTLKESPDQWATKLEISYMPLAVLKRYDPRNNKNPYISPISDFGVIALGEDWILNRWIIREKGIVIVGPSSTEIIDPISPHDLKQAVKNILCNSWTQHINGPMWMKPKKYQSFTILTMCRALYTLEYGEIVSKQKAANWAEKNVETKWKPLIQEALVNRNNSEESDMKETIEFLRYVLRKYCSL